MHQVNVAVAGGSTSYYLRETIAHVSIPNRVTAAAGIAFLVMDFMSLYLSRAWQ